MAEGLFRRDLGDRFDVYSAGTHPGIVRTEAVAVMAEVGVDISHHRSKSVDEFAGAEIDTVVTVCDNAARNCPVFPARTRMVHWSFDDPAAVQGEESVRFGAFRTIRDQIARRVERFARGEGN